MFCLPVFVYMYLSLVIISLRFILHFVHSYVALLLFSRCLFYLSSCLFFLYCHISLFYPFTSSIEQQWDYYMLYHSNPRSHLACNTHNVSPVFMYLQKYKRLKCCEYNSHSGSNDKAYNNDNSTSYK